MRGVGLGELAAIISRAWARGSGRPDQDADVVRAMVFDALREIRDREAAVKAAAPPVVAAEPKRSASFNLFCCSNCESILRGASALQRHKRFCAPHKRPVGRLRNFEKAG